MPFDRDDALIAALRARPENAGVLAAVESGSAHGDLGDVLFRVARSTAGMRVIPLQAGAFPALVATPADEDVVVVAASGMRSLLIRVAEVPEEARLSHERAPDLGSDSWRVNPFDPDVSTPRTAEELQRWFAAASRWA